MTLAEDEIDERIEFLFNKLNILANWCWQSCGTDFPADMLREWLALKKQQSEKKEEWQRMVKRIEENS